MNEQPVIYKAKLHWIIFLPAMLLCFIALYIGSHFPALQYPSGILVLLSLVWWGVIWFTYRFSSVTIKTKQVVLRTGFIVRQTIDIPLDKIESIDIRQSLIGSFFNYGLFMITGTGGTRQQIDFLTCPLTCRRHIEQLMHIKEKE